MAMDAHHMHGASRNTTEILAAAHFLRLEWLEWLPMTSVHVPEPLRASTIVKSGIVTNTKYIPVHPKSYRVIQLAKTTAVFILFSRFLRFQFIQRVMRCPFEIGSKNRCATAREYDLIP